MITLRSFVFVASCLVPSACFSPIATEDETDGTGSSGATDPNDEGTTPPESSTGNAPATGSETTGNPTGDETAAADSSTGDAESICGDGVIDGQLEECDDGENNGPGQACNADCQLNVCGDGDPGPDEGCDDGDANALALGACAPDCSQVIEERHITFGRSPSDGDFGPNPVEVADDMCPAGYAAMFSYTDVRRASLSPWMGDGRIDWVLDPYTAYTNDDGELVWVTDETPLLGVRDGAPVPLENPFSYLCDTCAAAFTITGMQNDWTNIGADNCNGWSSNSSMEAAALGVLTDAVVDYLEVGTRSCAPFWLSVFFVCVEQ